MPYPCKEDKKEAEKEEQVKKTKKTGEFSSCIAWDYSFSTWDIEVVLNMLILYIEYKRREL